MNPKKGNNPFKISTVFTAAVIAMLITLLTACSPAADETASQGNEISNGANLPAATAQVDDQAPNQEPTATGTASLAPMPESQADPTQSSSTQQSTPEIRQSEPAVADETPTPETDREYTLDELRQAILAAINERRARERLDQVVLGDSNVAQTRAEDAATNCLARNAVKSYYLEEFGKEPTDATIQGFLEHYGKGVVSETIQCCIGISMALHRQPL